MPETNITLYVKYTGLFTKINKKNKLHRNPEKKALSTAEEAEILIKFSKLPKFSQVVSERVRT